MTNWKEYKLGEIGEVITGNTPSKKNPKQWGDIMPFVTPTDFDAYNKNIWGSIRYLSEEGINAFQKKVLPADSVIVTCIGSQMGKVALNKKECVTNQQINSIIPHKEFNSDFIYYVISSMEDYLRNLATGGSTMPIVNKSTFEDITIKAPDYKTQTAIAEILSSLDDKIELNNKINKELENLAQTLFKQWFIDFEFPNENGEPYKSSSGEMVDSELGAIPKGWEVKQLKEILIIKRGGSPRPIQDYIAKTGLPWVKISDATAINSPFLFSTKEFIKKEGLRKTILMKKGSLVLSNSATPGLPIFLELDACIHDGWLHFQEIKKLTYNYLYLLFISIRQDLIGKGNGSIFINLKTDILKDYKISLATHSLLSKFDSVIAPLFEQIKLLSQENIELSDLKNQLLPKLISGELEVSEALKENVM
jgi:type I restriction enzyme S subunit